MHGEICEKSGQPVSHGKQYFQGLNILHSAGSNLRDHLKRISYARKAVALMIMSLGYDSIWTDA